MSVESYFGDNGKGECLGDQAELRAPNPEKKKLKKKNATWLVR